MKTIYAIYSGFAEEYKPRLFASTKEMAERLQHLFSYTHMDSNADIVKISIDDDKKFPKEIQIDGTVRLDKDSNPIEYEVHEAYYEPYQYPSKGEIIFEEEEDTVYNNSRNLQYYGYCRVNVYSRFVIDAIESESVNDMKKRAKEFLKEKFEEYNKPFLEEIRKQKEEYETTNTIPLGRKIMEY